MVQLRHAAAHCASVRATFMPARINFSTQHGACFGAQSPAGSTRAANARLAEGAQHLKGRVKHSLLRQRFEKHLEAIVVALPAVLAHKHECFCDR